MTAVISLSATPLLNLKAMRWRVPRSEATSRSSKWLLENSKLKPSPPARPTRISGLVMRSERISSLTTVWLLSRQGDARGPHDLEDGIARRGVARGLFYQRKACRLLSVIDVPR